MEITIETIFSLTQNLETKNTFKEILKMNKESINLFYKKTILLINCYI